MLSYVIGLANKNQNLAGSVIQFAIPTNDPGYNAATGSWTVTLSQTVTLKAARPLVIDGPGASRLTMSGNSKVEVLSRFSASMGGKVRVGLMYRTCMRTQSLN